MVEAYTAEVTVPDLLTPSPFGLFANVEWIPGDAAGHWQGGIQYDVDCYASSPTISACFDGAPPEIAAKAATWDRMTRGARAFTVFDQWDCSPVGRGLNLDDLDAARNSALRALAASAPYTAERVFWSGDVGNTPARVYPNLVDITTTPVVTGTNGLIVLQPSGTNITGVVDVVEGLGLLEAAAADCYHGQAWIHTPSVLVPALAAQSLIYERGGKLYTHAGNLVVVGRGYSAESDHGHLVATSPVFGIKGTPRAFGPVESLDRDVNTLKMIAEQTFLLAWHCCLIAVSVTTGGESAGGVSTASPET